MKRELQDLDNFGPALAQWLHFLIGCRFSGVFGPKLTHHPKYIIGPKFTCTGCLAAESTHAMNPRVGIAWIWREGRTGRFVNDALRRD
jgi:hypothetical protein